MCRWDRTCRDEMREREYARETTRTRRGSDICYFYILALGISITRFVGSFSGLSPRHITRKITSVGSAIQRPRESPASSHGHARRAIQAEGARGRARAGGARGRSPSRRAPARSRRREVRHAPTRGRWRELRRAPTHSAPPWQPPALAPCTAPTRRPPASGVTAPRHLAASRPLHEYLAAQLAVEGRRKTKTA